MGGATGNDEVDPLKVNGRRGHLDELTDMTSATPSATARATFPQLPNIDS